MDFRISRTPLKGSYKMGIRSQSLPYVNSPKKMYQSVLELGQAKENPYGKVKNEKSTSDLIQEHSNLKKIFYKKHDKIIELEYFNSFLEDALKKRECLIKEYIEENVKLKEEIKAKNRIIEKLSEQLEPFKNYSPIFNFKNFPSKDRKGTWGNNANLSNMMMNSYRNSSDAKNFSVEMMENNDFRHSYRESRNSMVCTEEELYKGQNRRKENDKIVEEKDLLLSVQKRDLSLGGGKRRHDGGASSNGYSKERRPFRAISTIVSETQGRRTLQSFFLENYRQASIIKMTCAEVSQALKDPKLCKIDCLLKNEHDEIIQALKSMSVQERQDIFGGLKALINDIKELASVVMILKKLLKASSSISVSLVLQDALEKIILETCDVLNCDRASVFILDQINRILWTKVAKGSNVTIKVSMDSGIVGYVATTGKPVRIDEAYLDERFNKDVDMKSNYRTRTILAIPIKDMTGNVIGVCQAINKLNGGLFTQDDEELFQILSDQAGLMLKNSIKFDDTLVTHLKLNRLLKTGLEMYKATSLTSLLHAAEVSLKGVFSSDKALIYVVDEEDKLFYRFDESSNKIIFPLTVGLVGLAIRKKDILEVRFPNNSTYYNPQVDIETHLSILCIPLLNEEGRVLALMEVTDLQNSGTKLKLKGEYWEVENLEFFLDLARVCIEKFNIKADGLLKNRVNEKNPQMVSNQFSRFSTSLSQGPNEKENTENTTQKKLLENLTSSQISDLQELAKNDQINKKIENDYLKNINLKQEEIILEQKERMQNDSLETIPYEVKNIH